MRSESLRKNSNATNKTRVPHWRTWNQKITARNGRSFYFASYILGGAERERAYQIYALCRIIDDATDESHHLRATPSAQTDANLAPGAYAGSKLSEFLTQMLFSNEPKVCDDFSENVFPLHAKSSSFLSELKRVICYALGISCEHVTDSELLAYLDSMSKGLKTMGLQPIHIEALVLGQRSDENFRQPRTFQEFYNYCYQVAGVVGLMMAKVFGAQEDPQTMRAAEHLGIAMQITNILRDIQEDHEEKNRVYIPVDVLQKFGCNVQQLLETCAENEKKQFAKVVLEMALWGMTFYQSALTGVSGIKSFKARVCVKAMAAIYSAILAQVYLFPLKPLQERIVVSRLKKAVLFLEVLFGRAPLAAAGFDRQTLAQAWGTKAMMLESKASIAKPESTTLALQL